MNNMKKIILAFLITVCAAAAAAGSYLDKTFVLLPADSGLKFSWIMAPGTVNAEGSGIIFRMGKSGNAWFGRDGKYLMSLKDGFVIELKGGYDDFTVNGEGKPLIMAKGYLGLIPPVKDPQGTGRLFLPAARKTSG